MKDNAAHIVSTAFVPFPIKQFFIFLVFLCVCSLGSTFEILRRPSHISIGLPFHFLSLQERNIKFPFDEWLMGRSRMKRVFDLWQKHKEGLQRIRSSLWRLHRGIFRKPFRINYSNRLMLNPERQVSETLGFDKSLLVLNGKFNKNFVCRGRLDSPV